MHTLDENGYYKVQPAQLKAITTRNGDTLQTGKETRDDTGDSASNGSASPMFGPFSEERARIDRITSRLDVTDDPSERADLGSELVRSISRYEDTFERAILPHLDGSDQGLLDQMERDREQLRVAMDDIHQRTMGIDPRNVHTSDGQGFEDTLTAVVVRVRALLPMEDQEMDVLLQSMSPAHRHRLMDEVAHASKNASERPQPPRTAVGRFVSNAHVKLDHTLEDVATPHHPGAETING
jgi:hypothetical protein